ncbi:hypothetical protein BDW42DRAFT_72309 [Aspergillus taichungensis]|uniref:Uncharacterized protein n=1 Tax=Aspergillus taichungensis TaxID=482145 RepID=A0A2J5HZD8_9EURO|nr:hypothetical protein BDW42DRAFT_72309 [Aspergillus taichungensis]
MANRSNILSTPLSATPFWLGGETGFRGYCGESQRHWLICGPIRRLDERRRTLRDDRIQHGIILQTAQSQPQKVLCTATVPYLGR